MTELLGVLFTLSKSDIEARHSINPVIDRLYAFILKGLSGKKEACIGEVKSNFRRKSKEIARLIHL
ncbi:hypothetical protein [Vibrio nigripulchritudo]|uniref:hypothetical protein n=1 Tax=Vibrio nigripulchritudo TaxID=28173 RepID=UPI0002EF06F9|nr:hypothetical protein [Vibrio nigripulchritudo]BDU38097.1 hypothetical protein TUMSATVNIG2_25660 [Vibrio nigripulchritudo]BDU43820.1 hypothetical protein TUMSATVNIG3_26180 [Vibrio nigripulchritudo]